MQVKVETELLRSALGKILSVVDKKNTRPILTNCLVKVAGGFITLQATDLEVSSKIILPAEVSDEGEFCLNSKNFFDILRELPNESLSLNIDKENNLLKAECGEIKYSLLITSNEEYPNLNFQGSSKSFELTADSILSFINKTHHAISTDETRPFLNGIYLQNTGDKLRAVATDGHRLALYDHQQANLNDALLSEGIILPKKGIYELKRMAESNLDSSVQISIDESFLYAQIREEYFLSVRLIARDYPNYQAVIPSQTSSSMTVDHNSFLNAVKRVKILANEKSNGVKLNLSGNQLTISANHPSLGDAVEKISVDYAGADFNIGFNAKYLIDTLSVFNEGIIEFKFNNELSPVIVESQNTQNFLGIVMPLKL